MKKFLDETKELLLSQGLVAILAIIQVRVVASNLGPEIYGNIGVYLGFVGISFRLLSSRNSDLILLNFNETNKNFIKSAINFEILLGSFSLFFVLSIFYLYYQFIPTYLWLYFLSRILINILEVFKGVYTHLGNMKVYSLIESSSNTLRFILVVSFILNQPTIESFFYALGIHQLIVSLTVFIVLMKNNISTGEQISFIEYACIVFVCFNIPSYIFLLPANAPVWLTTASLPFLLKPAFNTITLFLCFLASFNKAKNFSPFLTSST
jgi:O-antigen/teichoic acid export membrane protein